MQSEECGEPELIVEDFFVLSIEFDKEGSAWVGTLNQGLIKINEQIYHYNLSNSNISDTILIRKIASDFSDNIWIGTEIGLIKHKNGEFIIYDKTNSPVSCSVSAIAVDNDNSIWFTNCDIYEGGIIHYNGTDWKIYNPDNSGLVNTIIFDIAVDYNNNKWFTSPGSVIKYNNNKWTIFNSINSRVDLNWVDQITVGIKDEIWVSCDYSISSSIDNYPHVIKFNGNSWIIMDPPNFTRDMYIYQEIYNDSKGKIWVARGNELIYFYNGKWNFCCNLPSTIFTIKENNNGQIWLGTGDGIYTIKCP